MALTLDDMAQREEEVLTKCTTLAGLMNKVNNLPRIKAWIEKRPKTEM